MPNVTFSKDEEPAKVCIGWNEPTAAPRWRADSSPSRLSTGRVRGDILVALLTRLGRELTIQARKLQGVTGSHSALRGWAAQRSWGGRVGQVNRSPQYEVRSTPSLSGLSRRGCLRG